MSRARRIPDAAGLQQETALAVGGLRAVLLQLAHPAVGHGVAAHSDFAADPLRRLVATLQYIAVVADDDPALVAVVARRVGAAHRPVSAGAGAAVPYDARDPELQRFVAATIHDTAVRMATRVWGPLPAALEGELLARNGRIATALGVPAAMWPATPEAFRARFAVDLAGLRFDGITGAVARELLAARRAPLAIRAALPALVHATAPMLPLRLAAQLELRPHGLRSRLADRVLGALLAAYRLAPATLRRLPARRSLAAARADVRVGGET